MNLWCERHSENHRIIQTAIERIVYALQGMLADAERDDAVSSPHELICPLEALRLAGDVEGYAELVEGQREARLATERTTKPQLPGRRR